MARDAYKTVAGNMRSLTLAIEAMRQLERHGGSTMMERAFQGFAAIAPPDWKKPWREVSASCRIGIEILRPCTARSTEPSPEQPR